jgi:hypothetical protein
MSLRAPAPRLTFRYRTGAVLLARSPPSGPVAGRTPVQLTGLFSAGSLLLVLLTNVRVRFGEAVLPAAAVGVDRVLPSGPPL